MRIHYIVAASLFVGTSALAWGPTKPVSGSDKESAQTTSYKVDSKPVKGESKAPQTPLVAKSNDLPAIETPVVRAAALSGFDAKAMTTPETLAKVEAPAQASADPDLDLAVDPGKSKSDALADSDSTDQAVKVTDAKPVAEEAPAMGGPLELVDNSAALAPRPAAGNYPACQPGPGDDNCIQLYEPGVEVALASWNQPTGGLTDDTRTAMGGPFEPVDGKSAESGAADEVLASADVPTKVRTEAPGTEPVDAEPARKA
jgi:hypothetical protein